MIGKMLGHTARLVLLALAGAGAAQAQEPSPTPSPTDQYPPRVASEVAPPDTRPTFQLSLQDAVARTLEHNLDIAVQRYDPQDSSEAIRELKGYYDPLASATLSKTSATAPARDFFSGGAKVDTDTNVWNFGLIQNVPTGGSFRVDFNNSKSTSNSSNPLFNPSYSSNLVLRGSQPLLRDFKIDSQRLQINVAKRNKDISDVQFHQTVVNTVASVKQLYYDLIYSIDNLEAQRKSLSLAKKLLDENQIKVRVGTMAPLDVVAAESEVASREEAVIVAEAALRDAEDDVRRTIFPSNEAAVWAYRIVPTDRPTGEVAPATIDADAAVRNALEKRTDVVSARKTLENAVDSQRFAKNQKLPAVDLVGSYGSTGQGGTLIRDSQGNLIPLPIVGGFGDALGDALGFDFPTWSIGVNVTYPILNRTARASEARARINREQQETSLRRLEIQVTQEVRSAARALETNSKRIQSTRAARVLQERRLDAEEKRFAAGMSTNFLVTQSQRDLAVAEVAELRAVADYWKSVVNFERVQEAGGGVGFASGTSAAGRTVTTSSGAAVTLGGGQTATTPTVSNP